jgi:hypothetical protein
MAWRLVTEGESERVFPDTQLCLYTSDFTPIPNSVAAQYGLVTVDTIGDGPKSLTGSSWTAVAVSGKVRRTYAQQLWTFTDSGTFYGVCLTVAGKVWLAYRFDSAWSVANGDIRGFTAIVDADDETALMQGTEHHLTASASGTSETSSPNLAVTRHLTASASGTSVTSSPSLDLGGNIHLSASASGTSVTSSPALTVTRHLAASASGTSTTSSPALGGIVPAAPTITITSGTALPVVLDWADVSIATGYNIHRDTSASFTPAVGNRIGQPTSSTYTDSTASAGTHYYYKVISTNAVGSGPASNEVDVTTAAAGTELTIAAVTTGSPLRAASIYQEVEDGAWATVQGATSGASLDATSMTVVAEYLSTFYGGGQFWTTIQRVFHEFDLSTIPVGKTVLSAKIRLTVSGATSSPKVAVQQATFAASPSSIGNADFDSVTGSEFGHSATITGAGTYDITLDTAGVAYLNGLNRGITKLCFREYDHDYLNASPASGGRHVAGIGSRTGADRAQLILMHD